MKRERAGDFRAHAAGVAAEKIEIEMKPAGFGLDQELTARVGHALLEHDLGKAHRAKRPGGLGRREVAEQRAIDAVAVGSNRRARGLERTREALSDDVAHHLLRRTDRRAHGSGLSTGRRLWLRLLGGAVVPPHALPSMAINAIRRPIAWTLP